MDIAALLRWMEERRAEDEERRRLEEERRRQEEEERHRLEEGRRLQEEERRSLEDERRMQREERPAKEEATRFHTLISQFSFPRPIVTEQTSHHHSIPHLPSLSPLPINHPHPR